MPNSPTPLQRKLSDLLREAVDNKDVALARLRIEQGADPSVCHSYSSEPFHYLLRAIYKHDVSMMEMLLETGRSGARERNERGVTPIMLAAQNFFVEGVRLLLPYSELSARDDRGYDALVYAIRARVGGWAHDIEQRDACVEILAPLCGGQARDAEGMTALMHALCVRSNASVIDSVMALSDPRAVDFQGASVFQRALKSDFFHAEIIFAKAGLGLAEAGARDEQGQLPTHRAASEGQLGLLRLLESFSDFSAREEMMGRAPLLSATKHLPVIEWLLQRSDAGAVDGVGCDALMIAIDSAAPEECALRLVAACDVERRDMLGESALDKARLRKLEPVVKAIETKLRAIDERKELSALVGGALASSGVARRM